MEYTKTELHTHLVGMLSTEGFLELISKYTDYIYWPLDSAMGSKTDIVRLDKVKDKIGEYLEYQEDSGKSMDYYYHNRSNILMYLEVLKFLEEDANIESMSDAFRDERIRPYIIEAFQEDGVSAEVAFLKGISRYYEEAKADDVSLGDKFKSAIFEEYTNMALRELIDMGIEYVEISYSSSRIIDKINLDEDVQDKIKCRYLLATDRDNELRDFRQSARHLRELLDEGNVVGFDILGEELELTDEEKRYVVNKKSKSIKAKLEVLIDVMKDYPSDQATLRIHSGETRVSADNTEFILDTLLAIKDEYKRKNPPIEVLPPPEFRVGHGIRFQPSQAYADKLKSLGAIIEINATSNKRLGHIDEYSEIPYDYYQRNGIPIVICTDGHGIVGTTSHKEDVIAMVNSDDYEGIVRDDNSILERKKKV